MKKVIPNLIDKAQKFYIEFDGTSLEEEALIAGSDQGIFLAELGTALQGGKGLDQKSLERITQSFTGIIKGTLTSYSLKSAEYESLVKQIRQIGDQMPPREKNTYFSQMAWLVAFDHMFAPAMDYAVVPALMTNVLTKLSTRRPGEIDMRPKDVYKALDFAASPDIQSRYMEAPVQVTYENCFGRSLETLNVAQVKALTGSNHLRRRITSRYCSESAKQLSL